MCAKTTKKAVKNPQMERRKSPRLNKSQKSPQTVQNRKTPPRKPLKNINNKKNQRKTVLSSLKSTSSVLNQSNRSSSVTSNDENDPNPRARHGETSSDFLADARQKTPRQTKTKNISTRENRSSSANSSTLMDYLGQPISDEQSRLCVQSETSSTQQSSRRSSRLSSRQTVQTISQATAQSRTIVRKQPRKQAQPKKKNRKNLIRNEIKKFQNSTKLLIPRLPFQRLVREIMQQFKNDFRVQSSSLECLQEASECYLVQLFEDSYLCSLNRSRQTLADKDMRLIQILRGPLDTGRI